MEYRFITDLNVSIHNEMIPTLHIALDILYLARYFQSNSVCCTYANTNQQCSLQHVHASCSLLL